MSRDEKPVSDYLTYRKMTRVKRSLIGLAIRILKECEDSSEFHPRILELQCSFECGQCIECKSARWIFETVDPADLVQHDPEEVAEVQQPDPEEVAEVQQSDPEEVAEVTYIRTSKTHIPESDYKKEAIHIDIIAPKSKPHYPANLHFPTFFDMAINLREIEKKDIRLLRLVSAALMKNFGSGEAIKQLQLLSANPQDEFEIINKTVCSLIDFSPIATDPDFSIFFDLHTHTMFWSRFLNGAATKILDFYGISDPGLHYELVGFYNRKYSELGKKRRSEYKQKYENNVRQLH